MKILKRIIITSFLTGLSFSLFAAIPLTGTVTLTPEFPEPNESTTLLLTSLSFDVNTSNIKWYIAGKLQLEGIGRKTFTINVGDVGSLVPVGVVATTADGKTFTSNISISPASTLLLSEALESYVPPFYEGRALPGEGSRVKVVAFPTFANKGKKVPASNVVYNWSLDGIRKDALSGYGNRTFIFRQDELEDSSAVVLSAKISDSQAGSESRLTVTPYKQNPEFYEQDPLLGINLAAAFDGRINITKETFVALVPYFFTYDQSGASSFSWNLNGIPVVPENDLLVHLIPKEKSRGESTIDVSYSNSNKDLQDTKKSLQVSFDTQ